MDIEIVDKIELQTDTELPLVVELEETLRGWASSYVDLLQEKNEREGGFPFLILPLTPEGIIPFVYMLTDIRNRVEAGDDFWSTQYMKFLWSLRPIILKTEDRILRPKDIVFSHIVSAIPKANSRINSSGEYFVIGISKTKEIEAAERFINGTKDWHQQKPFQFFGSDTLPGATEHISELWDKLASCKEQYCLVDIQELFIRNSGDIKNLQPDLYQNVPNFINYQLFSLIFLIKDFFSEYPIDKSETPSQLATKTESQKDMTQILTLNKNLSLSIS